MANHLAMAALLAPGDDVLIEQPTYGLLLEVASYLGANILRFERWLENGFQIDLDEIRRKITPRTRLIVLTNLHNPSGALTSEATLTEISAIAATVGARVMVDEVYLDMVPDPLLGWPARSSFHLGDNFVVTNSLTKSYGLSGIRCGWILAEAGLAERIWRLSDLFTGTPVHPGELLSVLALDHLPQIIQRTRALLEANWKAMDRFLEGRSNIEVFRPIGGTVVFPRLKNGSVDDFCSLLREKYQTSVVPGHFFELPQHFRIGLGGDCAMTAEALNRLGQALDEFNNVKTN
jgi:aspartate/methionine/tyrosine aminotransferase